MKDVIEHYDKLIDENNDPFNDPETLKKYMDKWDGDRFICALMLDESKTVLEIGVGTGRLAAKVIPFCNQFWGIDISPKTISRASENLMPYKNVHLICEDFLKHCFANRFDVIYSSLTFMHIKDKQSAVNKIASLLNDGGIFVLSVDKSQSQYIDMGTRKIKIYPDSADSIRQNLVSTNLCIVDEFETEFAYVTVSKKAFSCERMGTVVAVDEE